MGTGMSVSRAVATVQVDNDHLRVTEWRFAPGAATGYHRHAYDYVVVPVLDGELELIGPDGSRSHAPPPTIGRDGKIPPGPGHLREDHRAGPGLPARSWPSALAHPGRTTQNPTVGAHLELDREWVT